MFGHDDKKQMREIEKQVMENIQLYKRVFDNPDGEAVLKDLEKRCFVNRTTFNENHGQMSLSEGRRSIYVYIINLISKDIKESLEDLTKE